MKVTIYHNPKCGTSRNVLQWLRDAGHEPEIIEYLKAPPTRSQLKSLIKRMGVPTRDIVRWKEAIATDLGLDKEKTSDEKLLDAMGTHPILINRPIVVTDRGVRLCRPLETVQELFG